MTVATSYRLTLPYMQPPLTSNQRMHWRPKAELTRQVRAAARHLALHAQIPSLDECVVGLVWTVTTRHRRDADNLVPTLKACCDGLVDAGVVPDDTPQYMHKWMPEIQLGDTRSLVLTVRGSDE